MNTLAAQIRDLFESMTPGARITSGLLLVVAVVSIAYLFQSTAAGPDAYLFGGERFSQEEINRMTSAMADAGLNDWKIESNRISVPRSTQGEYIAAVASAGAQPENFAGLMDAAIGKASTMESRSQFELRTKTARENQISLLISKFPWVESAYVMLDIQERRGFNKRNDASASVVITPKPSEGVDKVRARRIKQLVAGTLTSLIVDNVQITSSGSESFADSDAWFDDPYLQAREELQKSYKGRILAGLDYIPGVRVEVSANLDNQTSSIVKESSPLEGKTLRSEKTIDKEVSSVADGGGQPGQPANGPGRRGVDESLARKNSTDISRETGNEEFAVGYTNKVVESLGFKPKELYASIAVPRDYLIGIWQQENPEGDPTELTDTAMQTLENALKIDVERFVQNILPRLALGQDDYQQVEVVFFDSLKHPAPPEPTITDNAAVWATQHWGSVSMVGLAVLSLLMLRSAIRPSAGSPNSNEGAALQLDMPTDQASSDEEAKSDESDRPKLRIKKSESLKEDLSEMVKEDPDAAANILRAWINNAA